MLNSPYNLELYPITSQISEFEFTFVDSYAFAYTSENASVDFTTSRRDWNHINFGNLVENQPGTVGIEFMFGADQIQVTQGSGSGINPTGYDLNFSNDNFIADYNLDINFTQAEDTFVLYSRLDERYGILGLNASSELTTDRNVLANNLHVCDSPVGSTVQYEIKNNVQNPVDNEVISSSERYLDGNLLFNFDNFQECVADLKPKPIHIGVVCQVTLGFSDIEVISDVGSGTDFNLIECTPSTDFDLGECGVGYIYGKNLNYDMKMCPSEGNPDINSVNHNFEFIADFLDKECEVLELDAYAGCYAVTTFQANVIFNNVELYHGSYSETELVITQNFNADGYLGLYGESIFTDSPAATFQPEATHGLYSEVNLSTFVSFQVEIAYAGVYSDADLTDRPAQELQMDAHHGLYGEFDLDTLPVLQLDTFETGLYGEADFTIFPFEVFECDAYTGYYGESDATTLTRFSPEALYGLYGEADFTTFESESLGITEAYLGAVLTSPLNVIVSATLVPKPVIVAQYLRDGRGGVGGLNHCPLPSDKLDPVRGDNVIRLGFDPLGIEDQLNFSFDDVGDDPWTICNKFGLDVEISLQTQPRFEFDAYVGESAQAFIPLELYALVGEDVPLSRLYEFEYHAVTTQAVFEPEPIQLGVSGVTWGHPDDLVAYIDYHMDVELTLTPFAQYETGSTAEFDLATTEYAWKHAMPPAEVSQYADFSFEPVEYTRFCKGYIVPNGNSVVFDFGVDVENYDCSIWVGNSGEYATVELANFWEPEGDMYSGEYATVSSFEIQSRWTAIGYLGSHIETQIFNDPEFEPVASLGTYAEFQFEELPIEGHSGVVMFIDDLVVPGPGIEWQTETQCLPNDFKPLTPEGDIDLKALEPDENGVVQYPSVPVEYKEYYFVLDARCISFSQTQSDEDS